ncbi:MAG: MFS family permease [Arenicella sp.]|jgi:MFS family permease
MVMACGYAITSMMVLLSGIIGTKIAPAPQFATLPMGAMVIGGAVAAIPAALLMQRVGRKAGLAVGIVISLAGVALAFYASLHADFWLFLVAAFLIGLNAAFIQQGRFVIIENANNDKQVADGLTLALMANLFAAYIGPEIGSLGEGLIGNGFSGSFALSAGILVLGLVILVFYKNINSSINVDMTTPTRPLSSVLKHPAFILAAGSGAIGYGVMALVMTATPISMHEIDGHSIEQTKTVIQTHIMAMFLPSLLTGALLKRGFKIRLIMAGLVIYLIVTGIAFSGVSVMHYWWALLLLGLGWNFMFMTSTALLPQSYTQEQKFKAQAANDFIIFSVQAIAAFAAGWLLFNFQWHGVLSIALSVTLIWALVIAYLASRQVKAGTKIE